MKNIRYKFFTILFLCCPVVAPLFIYNIYDNISSLLMAYFGYVSIIILIGSFNYIERENKVTKLINNTKNHLFAYLIKLSCQSNSDPKAGVEWFIYIPLSLFTFGITTVVLIAIRSLSS